MKKITDEELMECAKEVFGDVEEFWKGLHPSVQRLVVNAMNDGMFDWKERKKEAEKMLNEAGLTKEDVEFKPKTYNVGGFEIKFKD